MKTRNLCCVVLAVGISGCTMNGKKMFSLGGAAGETKASEASGGGGGGGGDGGASDVPGHLTDQVYLHVTYLKSARQLHVGNGKATSKTCIALVDQLRATYTADTVFDDWGDTYKGAPAAFATTKDKTGIKLGDAHLLCAEIAKWEPLAEGRQAIQTAYSTMEHRNGPKTGREKETGAELAGQAAACHEGVKRLVKAGIQDVQVDNVSKEKRHKTGELATRTCAPLAKLAATWDQDVVAAQQAGEAKDAADFEARAKPYKALGITGDRLRLLANLGQERLYGLGGIEIDTPKERKVAKVIFLIRVNDGIFNYHRYEFRGDKQVSQSRREYALDPGIDGFH